MSAGARALVVEDEHETAEVIAALLQRADFGSVQIVGSVKGAREHLHVSVPDLVLLDLRLPDGDGIELIPAIQTKVPGCPILVLTSTTASDCILAALGAGASGYLFKDQLDVRLALAIRDLLSGGMPLSARAARILFDQLQLDRPPMVPSRIIPKYDSRRTSGQKHIILFLAANPAGMGHTDFGREARAIHDELERSRFRDCFELVIRWATNPLDVLHELRKLKPTVVHFSGHGSQGLARNHRPSRVRHRHIVSEPGIGGERQHGLLFEGPDGSVRPVLTAALTETFGATGDSVRLVVLSACYSEPQAEALLAHVDCVVGIGSSILAAAARSFAKGFYGGLGERESIAAAYRQGQAAISLTGIPDGDRPRLKLRPGVDADRLVLAMERSP